MYQEISKISKFLSEPFMQFYTGAEAPFVAAIALGIVAALAPCQLTGNISAITFYGHKSLQTAHYWADVAFFVLGKIAVFSSLGLFVWLNGLRFEENIIFLFPVIRKAMGPILMLVGIFLLGWIRLRFINRITAKIPLALRSGRAGAFLMGATISIAFCPTMFVIFFVLFMPIVLSSAYGMLLPTVFGIGSSIPLLAVIGIVSFLGFSGTLMNKSRKTGLAVQRVAGAALVLIGVLDMLTYWL